MEDDKIMEHIEEEQEPWWKGPIKYIMMIFLLLIIVMWYFPKESIKLDPSPGRIPTIGEVLPEGFSVGNRTGGEDYDVFVLNDPVLKQIGNKIAALSCEGSKICQAKAVYYFVRDNIEYVSDPFKFEYIESPYEVLYAGIADCDGHAVLLSALEGSIGINSELVFIPNHVFVRIKLTDAAKRYKNNGWIYLDPTCKNCEFGELPLADKQYLNSKLY